jgi:hypothetical protein
MAGLLLLLLLVVTALQASMFLPAAAGLHTPTCVLAAAVAAACLPLLQL